MIINDLYNLYYSKKRKRGYEVIGWDWIGAFITTIALMGVVGSQLILFGGWPLTLTSLTLLITLKIISRKTDVILETKSIKDTPKAKMLILNFLELNYCFQNPEFF